VISSAHNVEARGGCGKAGVKAAARHEPILEVIINRLLAAFLDPECIGLSRFDPEFFSAKREKTKFFSFEPPSLEPLPRFSGDLWFSGVGTIRVSPE
jgi:hypothetical protein